MIKFKIKDKEYELPNYISIDVYVKIFKIKDLFSDEYFAAKLLNILTDIPLEELLEFDYQEVSYLANQIMMMIPNEEPTFVNKFEIDGIKYGFFPNWQDLSFAEFIDMDTISTKKSTELLDLLHILAAIMYRPIVNQRSDHDFEIEKYNVKTMKERAELFKKKLDIKVILGAQFFFIKFANRFSGYSQLSSMPKLSIGVKLKLLWSLRKMIASQIFRKRTAGFSSSTELLETILRSTNKSTKKI